MAFVSPVGFLSLLPTQAFFVDSLLVSFPVISAFEVLAKSSPLDLLFIAEEPLSKTPHPFFFFFASLAIFNSTKCFPVFPRVPNVFQLG